MIVESWCHGICSIVRSCTVPAPATKQDTSRNFVALREKLVLCSTSSAMLQSIAAFIVSGIMLVKCQDICSTHDAPEMEKVCT